MSLGSAHGPKKRSNEKLAALDGDMGRESQTAYTRVMERHGQPYIDALCADLQLDVRGNEMRGGVVTMDPDDFNKPPGKRVCLRRLLKVRAGLSPCHAT